MNETQQKGLATELQVQLAFIQQGLNIYTPLASDSRCDLILEVNKKLYKIQIKTSRLTSNNTGIYFSTCSTRMNHSEGNIKQKYCKEDVDFFATYYNNKLYLIPVEDCQGFQRTLLFKNEKKNREEVYFIENYEMEKILSKISNEEELSFQKPDSYILQIDMGTNQIINKYKTYTEASASLGKGSAGKGHISQAARGQRKSAYGFYWKISDS